MSFSPATRGETECTSASKASAVSGGAGGVSTTASTASTAVTAGGVGRPCGSPVHPSRTTVQRVNNASTLHGSSPPSPVPRGCSASSCSVVAASAVEPAVAAATPPTSTAPSAAPSSSVVAVATTSTTMAPHRPHPSAAAGLPQRGVREDGAAAASSSDVVLPPLSPATPSRSFTRGSHAAAPAAAAFSPVVLPALTPHCTASTASGVGKRSGEDKEEERNQSPAAAAHKAEEQLHVASSSMRLPAPLPVVNAADTAGNSPSLSQGAQSQSRSTSEPYFRDNHVPRLFNELSEALLEARPENPVTFIAEWLRQRRDALA